MTFKSIINALSKKFGYEFVKLTYKTDAFRQQRKLLEGMAADTIFDLGANTGQTAAHYRRFFPSATIWSFEPFAESFKTLSEAHRHDARVKPHQLAVSDSSGTRSFFISRGSQMNSLLSVSPDGPLHMGGRLAEVIDEVKVSTVTLDEFTCRNQIDRINILKMDVQGGELLALQGADRLLKESRIDMVYCEVLFALLYERGAMFDQVWRFLERYGYTLYGLYNLTYNKFGYLGFGDAIFISPRLPKPDLQNRQA